MDQIPSRLRIISRSAFIPSKKCVSIIYFLDLIENQKKETWVKKYLSKKFRVKQIGVQTLGQKKLVIWL